MPAWIARGESEAGVGLLRRLQHVSERLVGRRKLAAACVGIERELGVAEKRAMIGEQLLRGKARGLFVAAEPENEIARRAEAFGAQCEKCRGDMNKARLVIEHAAPEQHAVLFDEHERIALPFFASRRHNIHVREQEDWPPAAAVAAIAHQEACRTASRNDLDVVSRKPSGAETIGEIIRHRDILFAGRGLERDDALDHFASLGAFAVALCGRWCGDAQETRQRQRQRP